MTRKVKYHTVQERKEAHRASVGRYRARKKAAKEAQKTPPQQQPIELPPLEEPALRFIFDGPCHAPHHESSPQSAQIMSAAIAPALVQPDIPNTLAISPPNMQIPPVYTDTVELPTEFAIHPNLHPHDISKTLITSPLSMQVTSNDSDPVGQPPEFSATPVAHGEVIKVEEPTQAAHGQPLEKRKARNAARQRRYRARRKASLIKKRVGLLGVLRATIQRRVPAVLLRAGCTLSQSGKRMIRDMCSWLPKLRHRNKQKALRSKTIISN